MPRRQNLLDSSLLCRGPAGAIDSDRGIVFEDGWFKRGQGAAIPTRLEFYSTKPPLLTVLAAGEYWLLKKTFGWSIVERHRNWSSAPSSVTVQRAAFGRLPALLARLAERWGTTDWSRLYVVAAACFGTLVTPFLITFNNHTVGTCSAVIALYSAVRILSSGRAEKKAGTGTERERARPRPFPFPSFPLPDSSRPSLVPHWGWFLLTGFFAGFTACNETPAAAFALGLFFLFLCASRLGPCSSSSPRHCCRPSPWK